MKKILLFIITLFIGMNVEAASNCSYEEQAELNKKASNIKVTYEVKEQVLNMPDGITKIEKMYINVMNVTEEFYVVIKNDITKDVKEIYFRDMVDGSTTFEWENDNKITNFTIQIHTSGRTNCPNEKFKTLYLVTPRFNPLSLFDVCDELNDFYLCQRYVTFTEVNEQQFFNQVESFKNNKIDKLGEEVKEDPSIMDVVFDFITDYKWFILSGAVLLIGGGYLVYRLATKKQRELGL